MAATLTAHDIDIIAGVLGTPTTVDTGTWFWNIRDTDSGRVLAMTLSTNIDLGGGEAGTMVSVHTHQGYLELHDVSAYLCIEPDEVMFVAKGATAFSSIVVGRTCTASLFSNIRTSVLRSDLTELDPAVLMAAMQLSLAESLLESLS